MNLRQAIRTVPDFPKKGILFYDITTLLKDYEAFDATIQTMYDLAKDMKIDAVAGVESRGFIFACPLAIKLGVGFIPIRKKGKLPAPTYATDYSLEYGSNVMEIHQDAIDAGQNVLLVDDLLATGGTIHAAAKLIEQCGGNVSKILFLIELTNLNGRKHLDKYQVHSLVQAEG